MKTIVDVVNATRGDWSVFAPEANKMKTATDKDGNVYDIGKVYEFSDSGKAATWAAGQLVGLSDGAECQFEADLAYFKYCRENQTENGTITKSPVELIEGDAYMFDFKESKNIIGIVDTKMKHGSEHVMFCTLSAEYNSEYATNIRKLAPEVK